MVRGRDSGGWVHGKGDRPEGSIPSGDTRIIRAVIVEGRGGRTAAEAAQDTLVAAGAIGAREGFVDAMSMHPSNARAGRSDSKMVHHEANHRGDVVPSWSGARPWIAPARRRPDAGPTPARRWIERPADRW